MKIDLHVHSKFSTRPSQWILRKIGCPESFVPPEVVYRTALSKGMRLVTITDHNTIEGSLAIAHLPHTFISEEITTFFPEDHCKIHVLAWNIDEAVHADIQHIRENIYDLAAYLQQNRVLHGVAHPLYGVNDKLTVEHFEKLLLLFKTFECNGARDGAQNKALKRILAHLDKAAIDRLIDKHGIEPAFDGPWRKNLSAGSDDHSGLNIARMHTEIEGACDLQSFFEGLGLGLAKVKGEPSTPKTLAHNLYGIGYQFYKDKYKLGGFVNKDKFMKFLDASLTAESPTPRGLRRLGIKTQVLAYRLMGLGGRKNIAPKELPALLRVKAQEVFREEKSFRALAEGQPGAALDAEDLWFAFADKAAGATLAHYADAFLQKLDGADLFDLVQDAASAGALYAALSPYFVAYSLFTKDRAFCRDALRHFRRLFMEAGSVRDAVRIARWTQPKPAKLAHFTDTFFETNGVAITLQEHLALSKALGMDYTVITCDPEQGEPVTGVRNFKPVGMYDLPEYPELKLNYPPLLRMLSYVHENEFTCLHSATPGPIGLAALLVARVLRLPISGTYHTALPQYALRLTGDESMEDLMWRYMVWYYNQMDKVFVPSAAIAEELREKGVQADKLILYPRGVDVERFTPAKRNGFYSRYNLNGRLKLLYVGRISREKNLPLLEKALHSLSENLKRELDIVFVGDGPYREEMARNATGLNCLFTGELTGEDLAQAYASSDLFLFPSTTDTFGKVILEAQASGLPVLITDKGGPQENILPGETGVVVKGEDPEAFCRALTELVHDSARLREMGTKARRYTETRSHREAFEETWELYAQAAALAQDAPDERAARDASAAARGPA